MASERLCTKALSRSASAFCFSATNAFVRSSAFSFTASAKAFFMRSFSAFSLAFSFSTAADLPTPTRLPKLSSMLSTFALRSSLSCCSLSAISLSRERRYCSFALFSPSTNKSSASASSLAAMAACLAAFACSASCFCLAMMKSVRSRCSLPVTSFDVPLSISRHSAKTVCISLMAFSSSLQDFPVSWFIQSHTICACKLGFHVALSPGTP